MRSVTLVSSVDCSIPCVYIVSPTGRNSDVLWIKGSYFLPSGNHTPPRGWIFFHCWPRDLSPTTSPGFLGSGTVDIWGWIINSSLWGLSWAVKDCRSIPGCQVPATYSPHEANFVSTWLGQSAQLSCETFWVVWGAWFGMRLPFKSIDFEESRLPSIMWTGLIQSIGSLSRTKD